jgi:hypothetical protein
LPAGISPRTASVEISVGFLRDLGPQLFEQELAMLRILLGVLD